MPDKPAGAQIHYHAEDGEYRRRIYSEKRAEFLVAANGRHGEVLYARNLNILTIFFRSNS